MMSLVPSELSSSTLSPSSTFSLFSTNDMWNEHFSFDALPSNKRAKANNAINSSPSSSSCSSTCHHAPLHDMHEQIRALITCQTPSHLSPSSSDASLCPPISSNASVSSSPSTEPCCTTHPASPLHTPHSHIVQFYDGDAYLINIVYEFIESGVGAHDCLLLVLTADHQAQLRRHYENIDEERIDLLLSKNQLVMLDANDILKQITIVSSAQGYGEKEEILSINYEKFYSLVSSAFESMLVTLKSFADAGQSSGSIRVFGELVDMLCSASYHQYALDLEDAWNNLSSQYSFTLLCGYSMSNFPTDSLDSNANFAHVMTCHSDILNPELVKNVDQAIGLVCHGLSQNRNMVPFALCYLADNEDHTAFKRKGMVGLECVDTVLLKHIAPEFVRLDDCQHLLWPVEKMIAQNKSINVRELQQKMFSTILSSSSTPPSSLPPLTSNAMMVPIHLSDSHRIHGWMVMGINAQHEADKQYQHFFELLVSQISNYIQLAYSHQQQLNVSSNLETLSAVRSDLLCNLAHQFSTPLHQIVDSLKELSSSTPNQMSEKQSQQLHTSIRDAQKLQTLVDSFLDYNAVEQSTQLKLCYEKTPIHDFVLKIASEFREIIENAGLKFHLELQPSISSIYLDRKRMADALLHLLANAVKYTQQGSITLRLFEQGDHVTLEVIDEGIGTPSMEQDRIFERFYRASNNSSPACLNREGNGIGLAIAMENVKCHGGVLRVESQPAQGSKFQILIPKGKAHLPAAKLDDWSHRDQRTQREMDEYKRAPSTLLNMIKQEASTWTHDFSHTIPSTCNSPVERCASPFSPHVSPHSSSHSLNDPVSAPLSASSNMVSPNLKINCLGARVLVVDDSRDMRDYMADLLRKYWKVDACKNASDAMDKLQQDPNAYQLIIIDLSLSCMSGLQFVEILQNRAETKDIPLIMVSCYSEVDMCIDAFQSNSVSDVIFKPFNSKELIARVNTHMELGRLRKRLKTQVGLQRIELTKAHEKHIASLKLVEQQQRKRAELAEEHNAYYIAFSHFLSHEIRNPISAVSISVELMKSELAIRRKILSKPTEQITADDINTLKSQLINDQECMEAIEMSVRHQAIVANSVLESAKIDANKLQLNNAVFDVGVIIERVLSMLKPQADAADVQFTLELPSADAACPAPVLICGDADRFEEVMVNLTGNALKFTKSGSIFIGVRKLESSTPDNIVLQITIRDSGVGMTKQQIESLFNRFAQVSSSTFHGTQGSGLGLYYSKKLIELMKGTIRVTSQESCGTEFVFTIQGANPPVAPNPSSSTLSSSSSSSSVDSHAPRSSGARHEIRRIRIGGDTDSDEHSISSNNSPEPTRGLKRKRGDCETLDNFDLVSSPTPLNTSSHTSLLPPPTHTQSSHTTVVKPSSPNPSIRVLVVEDNHINQRLLKRLLEREGEHVTVSVANDGLEAVQMVQQSSFGFDLIMMDIVMPIMDGISATSRIRALESTAGVAPVPIVCVSANIDEVRSARAFEAGIDRYLSKPIPRDALQAELQKGYQYAINRSNQAKQNTSSSSLNTTSQ